MRLVSRLQGWSGKTPPSSLCLAFVSVCLREASKGYLRVGRERSIIYCELEANYFFQENKSPAFYL